MKFTLTTNHGEYVLDNTLKGMIALKLQYINESVDKGQSLLEIIFEYQPMVSSAMSVLEDIPFSSVNTAILGSIWARSQTRIES